MSAKQLACEGTEELFALIDENSHASRIFVLFTGQEDPATGKSWCPDCVRADPVIEKCITKMNQDDVFIYCVVGDRPTWKDPLSPFRTDPKLLLKAIPTLVKWNTHERLVEDQCANEELVSMLFEDN
ncbi:thioredoxin domain-containing protein 17 isoform X2 [Hydra vulgaris]|uniref:Thioredoxin domain-containing protein 17 n=1 Tax=Hydra vulgaris TaxID=6087 RepID=A0ABM4CPF0_HYDVU